MDHIREECPGVDFPLENDPFKFKGYFQASVRKTLNARRNNLNNYVQDEKGFGGSSRHPQLTNLTDGYAEGFRVDGEHVPGIVTSIMEVKFSGDISGAIVLNQSRTHINDLAKVYDLTPTGDVDYAPTYVLVSNSQYHDVEGLGRYGEGQENDLPAYAKNRGVNMMHLRMTKDPAGNFYLEGDFLGSPADVFSWFQDVVSDEKIPFEVSCSKEN